MSEKFQSYNAVLHLQDAFGDPYTMTGKVIGEKTHGFNLSSGAWGLYQLNDREATPAVFIGFIPKGKRRPQAINKQGIYIEKI